MQFDWDILECTMKKVFLKIVKNGVICWSVANELFKYMSKVQLIAFNITLDYNAFSFNWN